MVQGSWISHLRLILWIVGGGGVVCLALAAGSRLRWQFDLVLAGVVVLACWVLYGMLDLILGDLDEGIAEEIIGSVQKRERGIIDIGAALFGPVGVLGLGLSRFLRQRLTQPSYFGIGLAVGVPLVLVKPHLSETIYVDDDTYASLGDNELVKALVLPHSRLAVSVRHASIAGD
jgi:hypothetical protein